MKRFDTAIQLINLLSDGKPHSKKKCSKLLGINQVDIKKHIEIARKLGVNIDSIFNNFLINSPLCLSNKFIIRPNLLFGELISLTIIDSTNQYFLKNFRYAKSGDVCISEFQFRGRGKLGRHWFSPFGKNICLSIYWCFKKKISEITGLSIFVSFVVAEVLRNFGIKVEIKYPNDIYLKNKKLAGILIETIKNKSNTTNVIIGIGINVLISEMTSLKNRISLQEFGIFIDKNELIIQLIKRLHRELTSFERKDSFFLIKKQKNLIALNIKNNSLKIIR